MSGSSDLITKLRVRGVRRVALQFPEGLKREAASLASDLVAAGFAVVVSGDPCYGACDLALDTVTGGQADVLVHFGHVPVDDSPGVIYEPWKVDFGKCLAIKMVDAPSPHPTSATFAPCSSFCCTPSRAGIQLEMRLAL